MGALSTLARGDVDPRHALTFVCRYAARLLKDLDRGHEDCCGGTGMFALEPLGDSSPPPMVQAIVAAANDDTDMERALLDVVHANGTRPMAEAMLDGIVLASDLLRVAGQEVPRG